MSPSLCKFKHSCWTSQASHHHGGFGVLHRPPNQSKSISEILKAFKTQESLFPHRFPPSSSQEEIFTTANDIVSSESQKRPPTRATGCTHTEMRMSKTKQLQHSLRPGRGQWHWCFSVGWAIGFSLILCPYRTLHLLLGGGWLCKPGPEQERRVRHKVNPAQGLGSATSKAPAEHQLSTGRSHGREERRGQRLFGGSWGLQAGKETCDRSQKDPGTRLCVSGLFPANKGLMLWITKVWGSLTANWPNTRDAGIYFC